MQIKPDAKNHSSIRIMLPMFSPETLESFIRSNCTSEETMRLDELLGKHSTAVKKFNKIQKEEANTAETIESKDIGNEFNESISRIEKEPIFKKNFGDMPYTFKMLELSKLISFQHNLNLDYVGELSESISHNTVEQELFDLCLPKSAGKSSVNYTKSSDNSYVLSSENSGLRLLGSEIKHMDPNSFEFRAKGIYTDAIVLLVGFGSTMANTISANRRMFLSNGFHRAFALYSKGIRFAPFVVVNLSNPYSEFPESFLNVPRHVALNAPRPPLLKDFTDEDLFVDLKAKKTLKVISIGVDGREFSVIS